MRKKILLLGSGELGKELVIAMQRLGQYVIAVDNYENAPAMQVAHKCEIINMLDGSELDRIVDKHKPDFIVPEIESIRTERFYDYEKKGYTVIPSAKAVNYTMKNNPIGDEREAKAWGRGQPATGRRPEGGQRGGRSRKGQGPAGRRPSRSCRKRCSLQGTVQGRGRIRVPSDSLARLQEAPLARLQEAPLARQEAPLARLQEARLA